MGRVGKLIISAGILLAIFSCEKKENKLGAEYKGPIEIVNQVEIRYSELGNLKVHVITPKSLTYSNQDKVFPDTVNIDFYSPSGGVLTHLRADSGRFDHAQNIYIVKGHVKVEKKETGEVLTTTELNWSPNNKKIYTDKPLELRNIPKQEIMKGVGMDADQDFSHIKFRKATGFWHM